MVGLRFGASFLASLLVSACAQREQRSPPRAPDAVQVAGPKPYAPESSGLDDICKVDPAACPSLDMQAEARRPLRASLLAAQESKSASIDLTGPLAAAPAVRAERRFHVADLAEPAPEAPSPIPVAPGAANGGAHAEMLDIEAHVSIDVSNIPSARNELTRLVASHQGQVVNEVVEDQANTRGASLSVRVPSPNVHAFLADLARIGKIRSQKLETHEISRTVNDAQILQKNLEHALDRYQELLAKAANVTEALAIEAELQRVRTSLERVRGDIEWMRDRVARSTVYVSLSLEDNALNDERVAKLRLGLRGNLLFDIPPSDSARSFSGAGLALAWSRGVSLDLDLFKRIDHHESGSVNALLLTLGGEVYSDFLGAGRRRYLNPYFGARAGYARLLGENALALGGTLGVELVKTEFFLLDLQARAHALIGPDDGVHIGLEPSLGINFAY